ncbi:phage integrase N-terminal domain-containing protein [Alteromonas halophila]|uniref:Integrase n=1 Tax=Alteromonas halophila TaxID=516698 RepID=A0A918N174_9ALTE|nr:phage integrase N-terminal domain-containing protein [Alteromonas halophila]GGW96667.1 integrase [Alteromonas halophila]
MSQLGYRLNQLVNETHKEGSFSTRDTRSKVLNLAATQLLERGYKLKDPTGLKTKHMTHLVQRWQDEGLAAKTIKNRVSALRWVANKINKPNIVARSNDDYGIARVRNNPIGKSKTLDMEKHAKINSDQIKLSLRLQQEFGLRREECIKFNLSYAHQGDHIRIKGSWAKGGRARQIPITNNSQRQLLMDIAAVTKSSLIDPNKNYVAQLGLYERETVRVGLNKNHGLRHHYARDRYVELTGWKCPADGGPKRRELSPSQHMLDTTARETISKELGHERLKITYAYLGS